MCAVGVVTDVIGRGPRSVMRLVSSTGAVLRVTPNHPIYVVDNGRFEPAGEVQAGTTLLELTSVETA